MSNNYHTQGTKHHSDVNSVKTNTAHARGRENDAGTQLRHRVERRRPLLARPGLNNPPPSLTSRSHGRPVVRKARAGPRSLRPSRCGEASTKTKAGRRFLTRNN